MELDEALVSFVDIVGSRNPENVGVSGRLGLILFGTCPELQVRVTIESLLPLHTLSIAIHSPDETIYTHNLAASGSVSGWQSLE
ncbi:hypothetical protein Hypma_014449 [Hypsizygus marmoreus]|uniref:Uncharacterized protein n=1 Tax=Hypsizygus marmoreus TaxID=39966 RepID=A0A369JA94_HYPMA|nr:hypothetical protein Hypma_014449 [Hypsizygus marmoreus]